MKKIITAVLAGVLLASGALAAEPPIKPRSDATEAQRGRQLMLKGLQAIGAHFKARIDSGTTAEPVLFVPDKVGIAYVDQVTELVARTGFRNTHGAWRIDAELTAIGVETLVVPANLVTPQGVARGKRVLLQCEEKLDTLMRENAETMQTFVTAFQAIDMPEKEHILRGLQLGMERHLDWSVRFVENQRAIVDIMRRVLAFAETRMGKMTINKDGALAMEDDADIALFNGLVAEMQREGARAEAVSAEALQKVKDLADGVGR
jgi:hypothetical protein